MLRLLSLWFLIVVVVALSAFSCKDKDKKPWYPPPCVVSQPNIPSGETSGKINVSYTYSTGGSSCSNGHDVQYLFDWGDGTDSGWLSVGTTSRSHLWSSIGVYNIKAQARCATKYTKSDWSGILTVTITEETHIVNNPNTPTGPTLGDIGISYTYTASGSSCSQGCAVQYKFNWGDGDETTWLPVGTVTASHAWTLENAYSVTVKARCSVTLLESSWSDPPLNVTIVPCILSTPNPPDAPVEVREGDSATITVSGSSCDKGHAVEYFIRWGDGTNSGWLPVGTTSATHSWSPPGTYQITTKARCSVTGNQSSVSDPTDIIVWGVSNCPAAADTVLAAGAPITNFGNSQSLSVTSLPGNDDQVILIRFDLSSVPSNATVRAAYMKLNCYSNWNTPNRVLHIHETADSWDEYTAVWNSGISRWDPELTFMYPGPTGSTGWKTFFSFDVDNCVQAWLDGIYPNYGFYIKIQGDFFMDYDVWIDFRSRQYPTAGDRPYLEVQYYLP